MHKRVGHGSDARRSHLPPPLAASPHRCRPPPGSPTGQNHRQRTVCPSPRPSLPRFAATSPPPAQLAFGFGGRLRSRLRFFAKDGHDQFSCPLRYGARRIRDSRGTTVRWQCARHHNGWLGVAAWGQRQPQLSTACRHAWPSWLARFPGQGVRMTGVSRHLLHLSLRHPGCGSVRAGHRARVDSGLNGTGRRCCCFLFIG